MINALVNRKQREPVHRFQTMRRYPRPFGQLISTHLAPLAGRGK